MTFEVFLNMSKILRLEGLPFKVVLSEVEDWIKELSSIEPSTIHMISNRLGRASGECYVEFKEASDAKSVLETCDEKTIGNSNRYVKIYTTDQEELNWQVQRQDLFKGKTGNELFCVRMYGLPFRTSEYEIAKWFLVAKANCVDVQLHLNAQGKRSGDATAFFKTLEEAEKAMERYVQ